MLYSSLLITTIIISLMFSFGRIETFHLTLYFLASIPILLATIYGYIKTKQTKDCDILSPLALTLRSGSFSLNATNVASINELSPYALGFCLFVIS